MDNLVSALMSHIGAKTEETGFLVILIVDHHKLLTPLESQ
jgi:hypothetical protein